MKKETASKTVGPKGQDTYNLDAKVLMVKFLKIYLSPWPVNNYQFTRQKGVKARNRTWEMGETGTEKCILLFCQLFLKTGLKKE